MDTILLATDGSDSASEALLFAIEMARDTGASVHVLVVRPSAHPESPQPGGAPLAPIEAPGGARDIANRVVAEVRAAGVPGRAHVDCGDEVDVICAAADRLDADLVVVGSHGYDAMDVFLFGSVSRGLVSRCKRPLTVVRTARPVPAAAEG